MKIKLPKVGERRKFKLGGKGRKAIIMEGTVKNVTNDFGGTVFFGNTSADKDIRVRIECLL